MDDDDVGCLVVEFDKLYRTVPSKMHANPIKYDKWS
jgi:hypothetical protein